MAHLTEEQTAQELFWAMERAKGRWRKFMKKPVRRVRRFFRKRFARKGKGRKGKGKGKRLTGKGIGTYVATLNEDEYDDVFFGGKGRRKGKGGRKGKQTTGKGFGRQENPIGPDGQVMKCYGVDRPCGSTTHLQR